MNEKMVFKSIRFYDLKVCKWFYGLTEKEFCKIYNGYGPDSWPSIIRDTLSWVFGMFPEISGAHDIDFYFSDGTRRGFNSSVLHWKQNASTMLSVRYPMSAPSLWIHRAIAWTKLYLARRAISSGSAFKFYLQAYKNRVANDCKVMI